MNDAPRYRIPEDRMPFRHRLYFLCYGFGFVVFFAIWMLGLVSALYLGMRLVERWFW